MPPKRILLPCEQNPDLALAVLGRTAVFPSFASCISLGSSPSASLAGSPGAPLVAPDC